jgi:hypothetical protein
MCEGNLATPTYIKLKLMQLMHKCGGFVAMAYITLYTYYFVCIVMIKSWIPYFNISTNLPIKITKSASRINLKLFFVGYART